MACKYVKDFKFDSGFGYTGSAGKSQVKAYMRGGSVKAPLTTKQPRQTPTNMTPLRTANAKTAMKESNAKNVSGASGKIKTDGQYAKGGMACASGCQATMKKGGKAKKASAKKAPAKRSEKQSDAMAEQVLAQMLTQAAQTGAMPGVPMQGAPMPAPNARAVPAASQAPMLPMRDGGKVGKVMSEFERGELHSGSKSGPTVKSRDQALAIALSESRKKRG